MHLLEERAHQKPDRKAAEERREVLCDRSDRGGIDRVMWGGLEAPLGLFEEMVQGQACVVQAEQGGRQRKDMVQSP